MSRRGDPSAYQRDEAGGAKRLGHALPPRILSATGSRRTDFHASVAQPHKDDSANRVATKAKPNFLVLYHTSLSLRPAVDSACSRRQPCCAKCRPMQGASSSAAILTCSESQSIMPTCSGSSRECQQPRQLPQG